MRLLLLEITSRWQHLLAMRVKSLLFVFDLNYHCKYTFISCPPTVTIKEEKLDWIFCFSFLNVWSSSWPLFLSRQKSNTFQGTPTGRGRRSSDASFLCPFKRETTLALMLNSLAVSEPPVYFFCPLGLSEVVKSGQWQTLETKSAFTAKWQQCGWHCDVSQGGLR